MGSTIPRNSLETRDTLIEKIIPEQRKRKIRMVPSVDLPSRGDRGQLGTRSIDLDNLDAKKKKKESHLIEKAMEIKAGLDTDGNLQPDMPGVNEDLVGKRIEQAWEYMEPSGEPVLQWCKGVVVAVGKNSKVHIEWDEECLREGDPNETRERLLKSKWNKYVEEGWRCVVDEE